MNRLRVLGLALVAVFAMSAVAVASASATAGPIYKAAGAELASGKSEPITATANGSQVLKAAGVTVTCTEYALKEAKIEGKGATTGGSSAETIEYKGCTVAGDGAKCTVKGKTVTTKALEDLQGYETKTRTGNIQTGFKPVSKTLFATLEFEGTCTDGLSNNVELGTGKTIGVICNDTNELATTIDTVAANLPEAKVNGVECEATNKSFFYEKAGTIEELKAGLTVLGIAASTYTGKSKIELTSGKAWGVFT
jgi:hypothetical protein